MAFSIQIVASGSEYGMSSQHNKNLESGSTLIDTEIIAERIRYDYEALNNFKI
jgi:hypothetical protein